MAGSTKSYNYKNLKRKSRKIRTGTGINPYKNGVLIMLLNCATCCWRGSELCPHEIKEGEFHKNKSCSFRLMNAKNYLDNGKGIMKVYREEKETLVSFMRLTELSAKPELNAENLQKETLDKAKILKELDELSKYLKENEPKN